MKNKAPFDCTASRPIPGQLDSLCGHLGSFYMKEIQLSKGKVALVDDEDYEYLSKWNWCIQNSRNTSYAIRNDHKTNKNSGTIRMHRLIMGNPKGLQIDHINHNGLDNRKENLRVVTNRENHLNRIHQNAFGLPGVSKSNGFYYSRIRINNTVKYLGCYKTAKEAHLAYMNAFNKVNEYEYTK